jgi:hypothetical protein
MRYKAKSTAALQIALGGLADKVRVETDPNISYHVRHFRADEVKSSDYWRERVSFSSISW